MWLKKKDVHNQHMATSSDTKFHQASLSIFLVNLGNRLQLTDRQRDGQIVGKPIVPYDLNPVGD